MVRPPSRAEATPRPPLRVREGGRDDGTVGTDRTRLSRVGAGRPSHRTTAAGGMWGARPPPSTAQGSPVFTVRTAEGGRVPNPHPEPTTHPRGRRPGAPAPRRADHPVLTAVKDASDRR